MNKRALVADNDFFFVEFLSDLLAESGYQPIKAYDGQEGMEKLEAGPVSVMFADLVMPKVDGPELIAFARLKYPEKPFPIIVVSGTIIEQLDDLESIGADYYIAKGPMEKMREQLKSILDHVESGGSEDTEPDSRVFDLGRLFPRRESVELLESLKFQKAIFENLGTGVLVIDKNARTLSINPRGLALLDRKRVDVAGRHFLQCFPPEIKNALVRAMKEVARNTSPSVQSVFGRIGDGRIRLNVSSMRIDGRFQAWILAVEEVLPWEEPA